MTDTRLEALKAAGVIVPAPDQVYIAEDVDLDRIEAGSVLHPGTRLSGAGLAIGAASVIGSEGPVVLKDSQIGSGVTLGSGSFARCTIWDGAEVGPGAHVRPGCLLEEGSSCAHTVGLKQTILMPHVVLGSLINFCDCMMTGGTSRSNHSEVGSSYIHFNYTTHRDKATASLMGDVPNGVMLDQPPIFLGGQGGIVGPVRIAFGTVLAAGTVHRRDVLEPGLLITGSATPKARPRPYQPGLYGNITRALTNNRIYLGNLHALREWYRHVRALFTAEPAARRCHAGALLRLDELITERIKQLDRFVLRLTESLESARTEHPDGLPSSPYSLHEQFIAQWPDLRLWLQADATHEGNKEQRQAFLDEAVTGSSYLDTIKQLTPAARKAGTEWLQGIVDELATTTDEPPPAR
jgi:UDP-N-acetylglucosamine/UDP-N-acetylgalactosamine diphosphorylase